MSRQWTTRLGNVVSDENAIPDPPEGHYWKVTRKSGIYANGRMHMEYKMRLKRGCWTVDSDTFVAYEWEQDPEYAVRLGAMQAAKAILNRRNNPPQDKAQQRRQAVADLNAELSAWRE